MVSPLTRREHQVARLADRGFSDHQIAEQLGVSVRTVQSHLCSVFRKLGIGSRADLAGLIRSD
jgi:DNA-binding NarL/FixJ family response regulator